LGRVVVSWHLELMRQLGQIFLVVNFALLNSVILCFTFNAGKNEPNMIKECKKIIISFQHCADEMMSQLNSMKLMIE
jgi:hypothetical protein